MPPVTTISPGALFSIYGQNFVPANTGRRANSDEIVNGILPTTLLGICVIDSASVEDDEDLHTMWANLLTNAANPASGPR